MTIACIYFEKPEDTQSLAEVFYRFTPQIEARRDRALFLEISKMKNLYSEESFLRRAYFTLQRLGIKARFGIAQDLGTALAFACYGTNDKLALSIESLRFYLDPFANKEEMTRDIAHFIFTLKGLGINTLEDFLKISAKELSSRFGQMGLLAYLQASAPRYSPLKTFTPRMTVREKHEFDLEYPVENLEPIYFTMRGMLDKIALRLRGQGKRMRQFDVVLKQEHALRQEDRHYKVSVILQLPYISSKVIFQITREKIENQLQFKPLRARVSDFEIVVTETAPYFMIQKDIFAQKKEETDESFFQLVSRFATKLGDKSVFFAQTRESYLPEKNWKRVSELKPNMLVQKDVLPERPLRLFDKPISVRFFENKLLTNSFTEEVDTLVDKEIVLADWWQSPLERIYYRLKTKSGKQLWVYKNQEGYFVHGVFD